MDHPSPCILLVGPEVLGPRISTWAREAGVDLVHPPNDATTGGIRPSRSTPRSVFLWAQSPDAALDAARLARRWDLPGNDPLAVERTLDPDKRRETLLSAGLPVSEAENATEARDSEETWLDADAFFRPDGSFVPCGLCLTSGADSGTMPSGLSEDIERELFVLLERAARCLGLDHGPLGARFRLGPEGPSIVELLPAFRGELQTAHITPLVHGRSPVQSWFASLAEAGGPFDTLPARGEETVTWRTCPIGSLPAGGPRIPELGRNGRVDVILPSAPASNVVTLAASGWNLSDARQQLARALRRLAAKTTRVVA